MFKDEYIKDEAHFARVNIEFNFFEKFYIELATIYNLEKPYLYVQHIGDKRGHKHIHYVVDTLLDIKPIKDKMQMTYFKNKYSIKGRQQWNAQQCKEKLKALVYCWRGCKKNKLDYKTNYSIEWLDNLADTFKEDKPLRKHQDILNVLMEDKEFIELFKTKSTYTTIMKTLILKIFSINRNYYKRYLTNKSLANFTNWCFADVLEHKKITDNFNNEIIEYYKTKNNKVLVDSVIDYLINTADADDLEAKINNLYFE